MESRDSLRRQRYRDILSNQQLLFVAPSTAVLSWLACFASRFLRDRQVQRLQNEDLVMQPHLHLSDNYEQKLRTAAGDKQDEVNEAGGP